MTNEDRDYFEKILKANILPLQTQLTDFKTDISNLRRDVKEDLKDYNDTFTKIAHSMDDEIQELRDKYIELNSDVRHIKESNERSLKTAHDKIRTLENKEESKKDKIIDEVIKVVKSAIVSLFTSGTLLFLWIKLSELSTKIKITK